MLTSRSPWEVGREWQECGHPRRKCLSHQEARVCGWPRPRPCLAGTSSLTLREKNEEPGGAQELTCSPPPSGVSRNTHHRRYPDSRQAGRRGGPSRLWLCSKGKHTPKGGSQTWEPILPLHLSQATLTQDLSERLLRESCSNSLSSEFPSP